MNRPIRLSWLAAVAVVALAATMAQATERPFGYVEEGMTDFSTYPFVAYSEGVARHVGEFTKVAYLTGTPDPYDPTILYVSGTDVMTAPNGDELYVAFEGAVLDLTTNVAYGTQYVVGGTGRFADATGALDFVVYQDPTGPFHGIAVGTIDY